ncbi:MAG TPA: DUF418 domain-containing protein [Gemmatimonadaceae bacterium]
MPGPAAASERVHLLDGVRGFALFGILMVNLAVYTGFFGQPRARWIDLPGAGWSDSAEFAIGWLFLGKFYSIFALLFGIGFALQLERARARGDDGTALYLRRILVLFGFGIAHMVLLWMGDILALYAMMGAVLLLFRRVPDRLVLGAALLFWLFPIAWYALDLHYAGFDPSRPFFRWGRARMVDVWGRAPAGQLEVWLTPDYGTLVRSHIAEIGYRYGSLVGEMRFARVLAMFLLGLWIGRRRLYLQTARYAVALRRICFWGFLLGIPTGFAMRRIGEMDLGSPLRAQLYEGIAYAVHVPLLAAAYVAAFVLLWQRRSGPGILRSFVPAGRMALTNYVMQSAIAVALFTGVGMGLLGRVSHSWVPLLAVAVMAFQIVVSALWLSVFRFGPLEWLWRSLTYGGPQPVFR